MGTQKAVPVVVNLLQVTPGEIGCVLARSTNHDMAQGHRIGRRSPEACGLKPLQKRELHREVPSKGNPSSPRRGQGLVAGIVQN
jgi:hypothetical protein